MSQKYQLNKDDLTKVLRQIAIIYWPVLILFLDQIETWEFDYKVILALTISITIDICRRFLKDYTQNKQK